MRVLFTNEAPLIRYGLAEGFRQTGHIVKVIQGEYERLWGQPVKEQARRLAQAIGEFKPDFLLTEGNPGCDPESVCTVACKMDLPHLYWAIEDPVSFDHLSLGYARHADYIFTTTAECVPKYQAMGKKAEVLLFGCNPEFHRFTGIREDLRHDIVLVASNYSSRYEESRWFVLPLVETDYDLRIWGYWWDDASRPVNLLGYLNLYGGLLPYEDLPAVYSSAKIILGLNCYSGSETQTSMRPYEAMACGGGLYVAHYTKAQENLFGDLIFQTRSTDETLATIAGILSLSEETRLAQAQRAQAEVYAKHDYKLRAEQIIRAFRTL